MKNVAASVFIVCLLGISVNLAGSGRLAQQPPGTSRGGQTTSIVRNGSMWAATIEYRSAGEWKALKLEPDTDARVPGDRIRVATTRQDNAIVTVELPIEAGKKYVLIWNSQPGMWDFSRVAP